MTIERSESNKLVITLPDGIDNITVQQIIDYFKYLDISSKSKAAQTDADQLAEESNEQWLKSRTHKK
jgi:hypothetical protein